METGQSGLRLAHACRSTRAMIAGLAALAVLFSALTAIELGTARVVTYRRTVLASDNLASSIAVGLTDMVRTYERALRSAGQAFILPGIASLSESVRRQALFGDAWFGERDEFGPLIIADARGAVVEQSRPDPAIPRTVAHLPAFTTQRDNPDSGLFVAPSRDIGVGDRPGLDLSRRISRPDGSFAGVAIGSIRFSAASQLLKFDPGPGGSVSLITTDGTLVARTPWVNSATGINLTGSPSFDPSLEAERGHYTAASKVDGTVRLYAFARAHGLPIIVNAATAISTVYLEWWREALVIGGATLAISAALLGLAVMLHRELGRRRAAELAAVETARQFRGIVDTATDIILRLAPDGTRKYVSPSVLAVLGYQPEELVGANWTKVAVPEDVSLLNDALDRLRSGAEEMTVKYRALRRDGVTVWLEARVRGLLDHTTHELCEVIAIARDITWQQHLENELFALASTDGLTGAANRRHFDERLDAEWRRVARSSGHLSLLLLDADNFKAFNDRYGHLEGDAVLKTIVACVTGCLRRSGDVAARFGGEEFAVLLPETDLAGALQLAEAIRGLVEARAIEHDRSDFGVVTVSIGVSSVSAVYDLDPATLVELADGALYRAKHAGRNRVLHAGASESALAIP